MTFFIQTNSRPINDMEFVSVESALEYARRPAWAGAGETQITMIGERAYSIMGDRYQIVEGTNPKKARAAAPVCTTSPRSALDSNGRFRGSAWLTREMDREDSDY